MSLSQNVRILLFNAIVFTQFLPLDPDKVTFIYVIGGLTNAPVCSLNTAKISQASTCQYSDQVHCPAESGACRSRATWVCDGARYSRRQSR